VSLVTKEMIAEYERATNSKWDPKWRSGRSTAIALRTIGKAMQSPGVWVPIIDHETVWRANIHLSQMIEDMLGKLELVNFRIRVRPECALMFEGVKVG
jgi:hypothetical protein